MLKGANQAIAKAAQHYGIGEPFCMRDPWGEILVLPAEHAHYLKSNTGFAFEPFFNAVRKEKKKWTEILSRGEILAYTLPCD